AALAGGFAFAMDRLDLLEAHSYLLSAKASLRGALKALNAPEDLAEDVTHIVHKRLFRRDWSQPVVSSYNSKRRDRRKILDALITPIDSSREFLAGDRLPDLYTEFRGDDGEESWRQPPIVPLNDELRWFL